jgi:hypothetical protein
VAVVLVSGRLTFCLLADKHDHRKRTGASMILSFMVGRGEEVRILHFTLLRMLYNQYVPRYR